MKIEITVEAETVELAVAEALEKLGVSEEEMKYEVLESPGKRLFGRAPRPAKVYAWVPGDGDDEPEALVDADYDQEDADDPEEKLPAPEAFAEETEAEEAPRELVPAEELSEADLDAIADAAVENIRQVLHAFGKEASIDEYEGEEGEIILDIVGDDLANLIGRHGKTLDALQTLVVAMTNKGIGRRYPIVVDVEGYRQRRKAKLEEMAGKSAERASRTGRAVQMRPMTSYERKVIHVSLRDDRRVTTHSEGDEPFRRVVIEPR